MSFLTDLTRMWLTRSAKPFTFTNDCDAELDYEDCCNLGLYVHIPFCTKICSFCPYCKRIYDAELCNRYIDALIQEIHLVGKNLSKKKSVTSLYFGGGTPTLAVDRLAEVIETLQQYYIIKEGIGLELHPDHVNTETLRLLKKIGVTKISIGIQSFQDKFQSVLGRRTVDLSAISAALKEVHFETVSMDLIFALPGQTFVDLQKDLELAFSTGANHVAIYPFIDFTFTSSQVPTMAKREKRQLLDQITAYCTQKGYTRTSIWTFAKEDAHYSSMTRDHFLGFGCSATTLLRHQFKINTFSVEEYCNRMNAGELASSLTIRFTERQRMVYYLFWTAYSTQVDPIAFEKFFGVSLKKTYGFELWMACILGFARYENGIYEMTPKGAFYYHYYENFYTLAYIDKMWGIMRKDAFPEKIIL